MAYVDIDEIRSEYLPDAEGISDTALETYVTETEAYVANRLGPLPPGNAIVYGIIRDLVISRSIMTLLPIQSRDTQTAELYRKEALRRLAQAEDGGVGIKLNAVNSDAVYSPFDEGTTFFSLEDFGLSKSSPGSEDLFF